MVGFSKKLSSYKNPQPAEPVYFTATADLFHSLLEICLLQLLFKLVQSISP